MSNTELELDHGRIHAALDEEIAAVFLRHAVPRTAEELASLPHRVDTHLKTIETAVRYNAFLDVDLANRITEACKQLVALCNTEDPEQCALVAGAVGYFLDVNDAEDDTTSIVGLVDDAQVVDFVIEATGLPVEPVQR